MASRIPGGWAEAQPAVAAAVDRLAARIRADSDAGGPAGADVGELVSGFYWEVCVCARVCGWAWGCARLTRIGVL